MLHRPGDADTIGAAGLRQAGLAERVMPDDRFQVGSIAKPVLTVGVLRLVTQQRDVPPCTLGDGCPPYPSNAPARYVLELNAGQASRLQLKDGAELRFGPGIPTSP